MEMKQRQKNKFKVGDLIEAVIGTCQAGQELTESGKFSPYIESGDFAIVVEEHGSTVGSWGVVHHQKSSKCAITNLGFWKLVA
jgi:hypothetical protein